MPDAPRTGRRSAIRRQRRIARTHTWRSELRATSTAVPGVPGMFYAQPVYVCAVCGHSPDTTVPCDIRAVYPCLPVGETS